METQATIPHAGLDAFYASVEQLLDPRALRRSMRRDLKVHGVAGAGPLANDGHAGHPVAERDQAFRSRCPSVIDEDATAGKRMAVERSYSRYPTCSTARVPAGRGRIKEAAGTDASSQSAHASRSRMTTCRS